VRRQAEESSVILGCYLLAFLLFFLFSILTIPTELLARFRWPFVWSNSFLLFMDYCLPVTVASVALSHSLGSQGIEASRRSALGFGRLVAGHLGFLIALAVIYSFLSLGLGPEVRRNLQQLHSLSREAAAYLRRAQDAEATGRPAEAVAHYGSYLAIDPDHDELAERARELETELQNSASRSQREAATQREQDARANEDLRYRVLTEGRRAHELMELARGFQEKEDYISAHYFYGLAARVDPAREDARRLAALAWQRIADAGQKAEDQEQRELYEQKREAYALFNAERYLQAYYDFLELQQRHPRNGELATWLKRSRDMVVQETFFLDDARQIDPLPGTERLLFLNGGAPGQREVVYVGKMTTIEEGTFFKDIEVLRFAAGAAALHYTASYGKLVDGAINLHGVQRGAAGGASLPRLLKGKPAPGDAPNMLALRAGREQLTSLGIGRTTAATVPFLELWQMRRQITGFGHSQTTVSAEILRRLLLPFSFLVLSLVAVAFGWSNRQRRVTWPVWVAYLFVPLFPLVALFFTSLYLHAQGVVLNFCLLQLGFTVTLVVFLVLQGVLLFSVLVLLAGQPSD